MYVPDYSTALHYSTALRRTRGMLTECVVWYGVVQSGLVDKGLSGNWDKEYFTYIDNTHCTYVHTSYILWYDDDDSVFGLLLAQVFAFPHWVHTSAMYTRPFDPLHQVLYLGTVDLVLDAFDAFGCSISSQICILKKHIQGTVCTLFQGGWALDSISTHISHTYCCRTIRVLVLILILALGPGPQANILHLILHERYKCRPCVAVVIALTQRLKSSQIPQPQLSQTPKPPPSCAADL